MSSFDFEICDWVHIVDPDPRCAHSYAELVIALDSAPVTRLFDSWSKTVTDRARLPLFPMAMWFASNWWRHRAEAQIEGSTRPTLDWQMSHDLPAVGYGMVWPRLRISSDGMSISMSALAGVNADWEPVQYLNRVLPARTVTFAVFDDAVTKLVELVLRRLADCDVSAEPLASLWAEICDERSDTSLSEWRKWEARIGFDPDEGPDTLLDQLQRLFNSAGRQASEEIAPLLHSDPQAMLENFDRLAEAPGIQAELPMRDQIEISRGTAPWDSGRQAARSIRERNNLGIKPLEDKELFDLLGADSKNIGIDHTRSNESIGLGVINPSSGSAVLHFRRPRSDARRFEASRFLAESLWAPADDIWLPLTDRATARQRFQRAFAAELLAPIADVKERFETSPNDETIDDIAEHFRVSSWAIRSQLANHGLLSPEAVAI